MFVAKCNQKGRVNKTYKKRKSDEEDAEGEYAKRKKTKKKLTRQRDFYFVKKNALTLETLRIRETIEKF